MTNTCLTDVRLFFASQIDGVKGHSELLADATDASLSLIQPQPDNRSGSKTTSVLYRWQRGEEHISVSYIALIELSC